ncbi:MAG: Rpn family recombination-promoting nuclease/putative transposase [Candidatus Electrothrix communis]|nr:MAG: Rpn family recombination-promoting nuclease/putative transposase [Candidatus Electrothrix communis]
MCRLNPRIDFVFKKLFGTEENKDVLIDFINAFVSEEDKVRDLIIKNPYNEKEFLDDKLSILDIKAQDIGGKWFNIEMQMIDQDYYAKRALYYWSRLYVSQLSSGVNYDKLEKTIGINILNFNCLDEAEYHNVYKLINVRSGNELIRQIEIHFIELEKYDENISNVMDRWVNFLKKAGEYTQADLPPKLKEIPTISKALDVLENMNLSEKERENFEARLKWLRDEKAAIVSAERRGLEKGIEQGLEQGLEEGIEKGAQQKTYEIIKNAHAKGVHISVIKDIVGFPEDEIKKIINQA